MITLYDFNKLDINERMEIIYKFGTYIDTHTEQKERCLLYAINMFFVEVIYNIELNQITDIKSFKTGHLLDKYAYL